MRSKSSSLRFASLTIVLIVVAATIGAGQVSPPTPSVYGQLQWRHIGP